MTTAVAASVRDTLLSGSTLPYPGQLCWKNHLEAR